MAVLLSRLGTAYARHRFAVLAVWLLVLVAGGAGAATLAGETSTEFSIPGQESTTALERIGEEFGDGAGGTTARVVVAACLDALGHRRPRAVPPHPDPAHLPQAEA